jgi:hypothetical protein
MTERSFRAYFVLGPLLFCSIVPSLIFGVTLSQWGSNLIWGSVFGLGWCLAAMASGTVVHDTFSTAVGLAWGWIVLVPLYVSSGWLWRRLSVNGRRGAIAGLLASFLIAAPAETIITWDLHGFHLPDYSLHLAISY